jgi:aminoglycoside 3-N-acetyltransferase
MTGDYSLVDLRSTLESLGIRSSPRLLVHSSLFPLGRVADVPTSELTAALYRTLVSSLSDNGTLCVPAAFEDYARKGIPYDARTSPIDRGQGQLSAYVASLPESYRTFCPLNAIAAVGAESHSICRGPTASCFGTNSAWEYLHEKDASLLFLGIKPQFAFTYAGYIQYRYGVPHMYNKLYSVPIYDDGKPVSYRVTAFVRYLDPRFRISEDCSRFEADLREQNLLEDLPLGRGRLYFLRSMQQVFELGTRKLSKDLFYFCKEPPTFVEGVIPTDGITGRFQSEETRFIPRPL